MKSTTAILTLSAILCVALSASAQDAGDPSAIRSTTTEYSPYLNHAYPDQVFFGDSQDPDFDESLRAFYYVRVLEIPTPRWTLFDAKFFGVKIPEGVPTTIQDRAYTSPIWYTPAGHV